MSKEDAYSFLYALLGLFSYSIVMFYLLHQRQKGIIVVENLAAINSWIAYFIVAYAFIFAKVDKYLHKNGNIPKEGFVLRLFRNITCFFIGTLLSVMFFIMVL